jgi:hypothetical protein
LWWEAGAGAIDCMVLEVMGIKMGIGNGGFLTNNSWRCSSRYFSCWAFRFANRVFLGERLGGDGDAPYPNLRKIQPVSATRKAGFSVDMRLVNTDGRDNCTTVAPGSREDY